MVAFAVYPFAAEALPPGANVQNDLYRQRWPWGHSFYYGRSARHATNSEHYSYQFLWHQRLGRAVAGAFMVHCLSLPSGLSLWSSSVRKAQAKNEGYGTELLNEPETPDNINLPNPLIAISPLILVGLLNLLFTWWIPVWYGASHQLELPGLAAPITTDVAKITAIWAVEAALIAGILLVVIFRISQYSWKTGRRKPYSGRRRNSGCDEHRLRIWLRCGYRRPTRFSGALKGAGRHS